MANSLLDNVCNEVHECICQCIRTYTEDNSLHSKYLAFDMLVGLGLLSVTMPSPNHMTPLSRVVHEKSVVI